MTRITIWETPDNREKYADVACEYLFDKVKPCTVLRREHVHLSGHHAWRIYRDTETAAEREVPYSVRKAREEYETHGITDTAAVQERKRPPCGRRECKVSTGIHEGVTAGIGGPDRNGFFDEPCTICEDYFSKRLNDTAAPTTAAEPATDSNPTTHLLEPDTYQHAVENIVRLVQDHKEFCASNRASACDVSVYEVRMLLEHFGVVLTNEQKQVFV